MRLVAIHRRRRTPSHQIRAIAAILHARAFRCSFRRSVSTIHRCLIRLRRSIDSSRYQIRDDLRIPRWRHGLETVAVARGMDRGVCFEHRSAIRSGLSQLGAAWAYSFETRTTNAPPGCRLVLEFYRPLDQGRGEKPPDHLNCHVFEAPFE